MAIEEWRLVMSSKFMSSWRDDMAIGEIGAVEDSSSSRSTHIRGNAPCTPVKGSIPNPLIVLDTQIATIHHRRSAP